jgi:hypothetical protein
MNLTLNEAEGLTLLHPLDNELENACDSCQAPELDAHYFKETRIAVRLLRRIATRVVRCRRQLQRRLAHR